MTKNKYPVGYKFNYLTILEYCEKKAIIVFINVNATVEI